jgi:hypothetical protein
MVAGCLERQGQGMPPEEVLAATEDYLDSKDTVSQLYEAQSNAIRTASAVAKATAL